MIAQAAENPKEVSAPSVQPPEIPVVVEEAAIVEAAAVAAAVEAVVAEAAVVDEMTNEVIEAEKEASGSDEDVD